jgi:hypothetical protein
MQITHYSCQILMKFEFSQQIFEKYRISNFMEMEFHVDGQTDGQRGMT